MKSKLRSKFLMLVLVLAIVLASFFSGFSYNAVVLASSTAKNVYGNTIQIYGFGENVSYNGSVYRVNLGEKVYFPTIKYWDGTNFELANNENLTVTVSNPRNQNVIWLGDAGSEYFIADDKGSYYSVEVIYHQDDHISTVVKDIKIFVDSQDFSIVLPNNSEYVIPAKIPANWTATSGNQLKVPVPNIYLGENEFEISDGSEYELVVSYKINSGVKTQLNKDANDEFYPITIAETTGLYTIYFEVVKGSSVLASLTKTFNVAANVKPEDIKLSGEANSTYPTSGVAGKLITLPSFSVYDANKSTTADVASYIDIEVTCITNTLEADGKTYVQYDYSSKLDNFKFTPIHKGDYHVIYYAIIPLYEYTSNGEEIKCRTKIADFTIKDVTDLGIGATPTVVPTYGYEYLTLENQSKFVNKVYTSFDYFTDTDENNDDYYKLQYTFQENSNLITSVIVTEYVDNTSIGVKEEYTLNNTNLPVESEVENHFIVQKMIDKLIENTEADIPSVVELQSEDQVTSASFYIPAIYAIDNFNTIDELILTRQVKINNRIVTNSASDTPAPNNLAVLFKTDTTATSSAVIIMSAKDELDNMDSDNYPLIIKGVNALSDAGTPALIKDGKTTTIVMESIYNSIKSNEVLKFNVPTATDLYDERVEVKTYYKLNNESTEYLLTKINKNGKYEIDMNDFDSSVSKITIVVKAYNDYSEKQGETYIKKSMFNKDNPSEIKEVVINILNIADEIPANISIVDENNDLLNSFNDEIRTLNEPYVTSGISEFGFIDDAKEIAPFDQNMVDSSGVAVNVKLPTFLITDNKQEITVEVRVVDEHNRTINLSKNYSLKNLGSGTFKYTAGEIYGYYAGLYTITYLVSDIGGNITAVSYGIRFNDTEAPLVIVVNSSKYNEITEVGEEFKVPTAMLRDNGENIENVETVVTEDAYYVIWEIESVNGSTFKNTTAGFIPTSPGMFKVTYTGYDENGNNSSVSYYVIADDTIAPLITTPNDYVSVYPTTRSGEEDIEVTIPFAYVTDLNLVDSSNTLAIYTISNDSNSTITYSQGDSTFIAPIDGIYTITYSATDKYGNSAVEVSIEIFVGDYQSPEIMWENQSQNLQTTINLGETLSIDKETFTIFDPDVADDEIDTTTYTFTLEDPNGNKYTKSSTDTLTWTLNTVGEYKLSVKMTDRSNKIATKTYTITVPAEEEIEPTNIAPVIGTILIVVSVVILAGVVVYFILSSKVLSKKSSTKSKDDKIIK